MPSILIQSILSPPIFITAHLRLHTRTHTEIEHYKAEFTQTTRGRDQLIFCGQPFIYEKCMTLPGGGQKRLWRCNQWWNKRCRARVYTIGEVVTPLNKYHTHEDIIKRKKRVSRARLHKSNATTDETATTTIEVVDGAGTTATVVPIALHEASSGSGDTGLLVGEVVAIYRGGDDPLSTVRNQEF